MKIKTIHVEVKSLDSALEEAAKTYDRIASGKSVSRKEAVYFASVKDMRKTLTEKRLELLIAIRERKPSSVYELAKMLRRNLKNVLQDVAYLQSLGIIDVDESQNRKVPTVHYDRIAFEVAL